MPWRVNVPAFQPALAVCCQDLTHLIGAGAHSLGEWPSSTTAGSIPHQREGVKENLLIKSFFRVFLSTMIILKLRSAIEQARHRNNKRITYAELARRTGIAEGTLQQMGRDVEYHPTLTNVEKLCRALDVELTDMIEMIDDPPKAKRTGRKKKRAR